MKIGVVSDTHSKPLPEQMIEEFKTVDMIICVGDFCDLGVYQTLEKIVPVKAVCGNMDNAQVRRELPRTRILECEECRIGLMHGEGPSRTILSRVKEQFLRENVDAIIFGHTHDPFNEEIDGVLYFNPGSPNDEIFAPYRSYGILDVSGKKIKGTIVKIKG
ncbi:MAG: metallophosphoesterase family protein [Candidatus Omnitrophica bacterium]|nr:metallophosphoesterase family protein [Candidatus Omnitrophota bacterium]